MSSLPWNGSLTAWLSSGAVLTIILIVLLGMGMKRRPFTTALIINLGLVPVMLLMSSLTMQLQVWERGLGIWWVFAAVCLFISVLLMFYGYRGLDRAHMSYGLRLSTVTVGSFFPPISLALTAVGWIIFGIGLCAYTMQFHADLREENKALLRKCGLLPTTG